MAKKLGEYGLGKGAGILNLVKKFEAYAKKLKIKIDNGQDFEIAQGQYPK